MQVRDLTAGLLAASVTDGVANKHMGQHSIEFTVGWFWYLARSCILFSSCESLVERPSFLQALCRELDVWPQGFSVPALQLGMQGHAGPAKPW